MVVVRKRNDDIVCDIYRIFLEVLVCWEKVEILERADAPHKILNSETNPT